jgi:hypothetical protein
VWAGVLVACLRLAGAEVRLAGRVVDENGAAVEGAQVFLRPEAGAEAQRLQAIADPTGKFTLDLPAPGAYRISAQREGYFRIDSRPVSLADGANDITLVLNLAREVFERLDVSYSPPAIDFDRSSPEERLTLTQMLEVPYPSTNTLRNTMRALPGIVQDSDGGVHLNGGTEEQTLYTLDGFEINDPLTGRLEARLGVEAVRSLDVTPFNPAEFGRGPAGTLAIKTSTGDDRLRYSATNFIPSLENRKGLIVGGWTPRFNLSGPIWRGRAWFSDALDLQYDQNVVEELPAGQDRSTSWRVGNLLRSQVNLRPSNILYTGFLVNFWIAPQVNLGPLHPLETTIDLRSRQWFFNVKDQWYFGRGALIEAGYAASRTFGREIPQGHDVLRITPEGWRGNSFWDATRRAGRDQWLANVFLPSFTWLGGHQLKTGIDIIALSYWQDVTRTGYVYLRDDNLPSLQVAFGGSGLLRRRNMEVASYLQDSWKVRPSVLVEAGLRQDWDRLLGSVALSPRIGVSWAPPRMESTKISASYGVVCDETNLQLLSRPLDQYALATHYLADGSVAWGPAASVFQIGPGRLKNPLYKNWTAGLERRFPAGLYARFQYTRRRGRDGLTYVNTLEPNVPPPPDLVAAYGTGLFDAVYRLTNLRRDVYDAFEATVRQTFRKQYEWLASYTRSRALSNAVVDVNVDDPVLVTANGGRMPWDAPHRFVSWGYLPTFRPSWAIAYLVEARNGFPFSVQDEQGRIQGGVNELRFPAFFELNLHLERRFVFHRAHWAFRFGFNNITNHRNPNTVNNDLVSAGFMTFSGGQSRALNFRLRWLGR